MNFHFPGDTYLGRELSVCHDVGILWLFSVRWFLEISTDACFLVPQQAVIFVDNAGSDVVLGVLPFARELLRRGTKVCYMPHYIPWRRSSDFLYLLHFPMFAIRKQVTLLMGRHFWVTLSWKILVLLLFCTNRQSQSFPCITGLVLFHNLLYLQVVLAANDMPSINDITYEELVHVISTVRSWISVMK